MIDQILKFDIYFVAIFIMGLLAFVISRNDDKYNYRNKILFSLILVNMAGILLEISTHFLDGNVGSFFSQYYLLINDIIILIAVSQSVLWAIYIDYLTFGSIDRLRGRLFYTPFILYVVVILVINRFNSMIFIIKDGFFVKGDLHSIVLASVAILLIYVYRTVIKNANHMKDSVVIGTLGFVIIAPLVEMSEFIFGELPYTFVAVSISILFSYIFIETLNSRKDSMTNLSNREIAYNFINSALSKNEDLTIAVIDLDNLKGVNDELGHVVGDQVIVFFAKILKNSFNNKAEISRLGGDEFVVSSSKINSEFLVVQLERVKKLIDNSAFDYKDHLNFSYGIAESDYQTKEATDIIRIADKRMYKAKQRKKAI